jgi:hypothetical protein
LFFLDPWAGDRKLPAGDRPCCNSTQEYWGPLISSPSTASRGDGRCRDSAPSHRGRNRVVGQGHNRAFRFMCHRLCSCSSFHNPSFATVYWSTVSRLRYQNWRSRDFVTGCAIGLTMIARNVKGLCLIAWNPELYEYWHGGFGAISLRSPPLYAYTSRGRRHARDEVCAAHAVFLAVLVGSIAVECNPLRADR